MITAGSNVVSDIGRGGHGRLSLSGGSTTVNFGHRIRIGSGIDGFGWLAVSDDASLVVGRAGTSSIDTSYGDGRVSIDLGADDEGALGTIRMDSGGSLTTRRGIAIGRNGIFRVRGSDTTEIGIGSVGNGDGFWLQKQGGILCVNIDDDDTGVTPIFVDEVDTSNGSAGNVVFENGALLYVDFSDASNPGTFTVMEWEGSVTNHGLALHPDVNTDVWSFEIDTTDKKLKVTAAALTTSVTSIIWRNTASGGYLTATTGVKDNDFANKVNWGWDGDLTGAKAKIDFDGVNRAELKSGSIENLYALEIGCNGGNGEFEQSGGSLSATANSSAVSRIGRGQTGAWIMSGGTAEINAIQIGLEDGAGNMIIEGGDLTVKRIVDTYSLIVGKGGTANFEISGGSLTTRSGVKVSDKGTFSVRGSGATIGIGSYGSEDGRWLQESGGLLEIMIDDTATGVAKIEVKETDDGSSNSYNGDVTFENGALLAPSFLGAANQGTFTIMEWDGTVTNNGLAFHPDVNTDVWSFEIDTTDKELRVTAVAGYTDSEGRTVVEVDSIDELRQYLDRDDHHITMAPGTYWMTGPTTRPAASKEGGRFLDFRGEGSIYVFTDVHIKVDTQELYGYGSTYSVHMLHVTGDNITVDGLTLSMEKLTLQGKDKYGLPMEWFNKAECSLVRVIGSNTTIKNCEFTTGGSYPYGYGDAFGKGLRPVDENGVTDAAWSAPKKMSGFLITEGASDVKVENVTLNMKSFGHGFYIQLGAKDIVFRNCTILGDVLADSDDIIAHPEYQSWGFASYSEPIPPDIRISKHEDGIRFYLNDDYQSNNYPQRIRNVTIDNCRIERMRNGIACGDAAGYLRVSDTEVYECEHGFGVSGQASENTFTDCKGDALNGPLIYFQRSVDNPVDMEIELTGDCPGKGIWPIALISGDENEITLTSSAKPGVYSKGAYVNLSQKWREWRHRPDFDIDAEKLNHYAESATGNTILNYTDQILVFGENATDNTDCESWGPVIDKGSGNEYVGSDLVSGPIVVRDTWSAPPNPWDVPWAQWDSEGNQILPTPPYTVYDGLELYYSDNYPVYALGVPISDNSPTWEGETGTNSYSITPSLPDGLSFNTTTGVISGTPNDLKEETIYTVTATNSGDSATVDLRITVNDVVDILLEGKNYSRKMRVTFNGSGSWVTAGSTVETFEIGHTEVANSSHQSLKNDLDILERKEGIRDVLITGGPGDNPMNTALSGSFPRGQYVALDTPITMTADVCNSPFQVIGLLFDDDDDEGTGKDDIVLVTDQPEDTTTWPAGATITYDVGATSSFSLDSGIGADFDDAFNIGDDYTLDEGLVGSLEIARTVIPSNLQYFVEGDDTNTPVNDLTFTLGQAITPLAPMSGGSAVDTYTISSDLPAGLEIDQTTGVISGTPTGPNNQTTYTVTATNTAGSVTKDLTITVNDVVAIFLEGTTDVYKMRVTFNGETGSWVTAADTASAFTYDDQDVANSNHESLENDQEIGETKEGIRDVEITGGDPMNAALSGSFTDGQYVALATPIAMTANAEPTSFNVIGLLFDDDSTDQTLNGDDIVLVTDQPGTTTWPAGTKITYTAGATATFSLYYDPVTEIGAAFDDAFNIGDDYTLDEGLVGSLEIDETVAPTNLTYPTDDNDTLIFSLGVPVEYVPTSEGSTVDEYSINPSAEQLPAGLNFSATTGVIWGTPTELSEETTYTVTAENTADTTTVTLKIIVNDVVAIFLEGTEDVYKMRVTFNGETGSWVTAADTVSAFTYDDDDVANSDDDSLGNLSREGFKVDRITGGNAMNAALNDTDSNGLPAYPEGQYVALATPIAMEAETDPDPTEFYVIGLLFDDDSNDPTPNEDDIVLVTDQPEDTTTWPAGTKITYTVGASSTFLLNSNLGADFDDAFNIGDDYTLNEGLVGSLEIAATVAPTNLTYTTDGTLTFNLGVNAEYVPTSEGSAVDTYTISPALPDGLSLSASGVISGAPTGLNAATSYTVTATNTAYWTTATLTITVNDVVAILLEGTDGDHDMRVTFNGETGSWVTAVATASAFIQYADSAVCNSDDTSLGGENKEGIRDLKITGGNAIKEGGSGSYVRGQYVALNPEIAMEAETDPDPTNFYVIGLLFDDDGESMVNEDDITLVTNQADTISWPAGTKITYTAGASATFSLNSDDYIEANFGQAFNKGDYTLDEGLVGRLQIAATLAPTNLTYTTDGTLTFTLEEAAEYVPTSEGSAVDYYEIVPEQLPAGLDFDENTGVISGTPTVLSAATEYTVTATNTAGEDDVTLTITVNDVAPSGLSYATNPAIYTVGTAITPNAPSSTGGAVVSYSISPALPAELEFDQPTGEISGTPTELSSSVYYTVTATNTGGSATATLIITVNDEAPSNLRYTTNSATYYVGVVIITPNAPSSTGGAVVSYQISPSLPDGLEFDQVSGEISGTPTELSSETEYTVTAANTGGWVTAKLTITVRHEAPSNLRYTTNPAIYTKDVEIADNVPSSTGGAVGSYQISPSLPDGLNFDPATGVISGTPNELSAETDYTVTAINTGGSDTVKLTITVNHEAPSNLSYTTNPAIYTKDVEIADNVPTSTGGAVGNYSISPALPAGLSLSTSSGVISGTPNAVSPATDYTVTATNTAGSATVTLRITVNDQKHLVLLLKGTSGSRDMRVTFNGTGSWVTAAETANAFTYGDPQVANSSDSSLTNAESKEGFQDLLITGGDPMKAALSDSSENGQYVALATPIAMTSDDGAGPFSFNVIGLLFDDDSTDSTPNGDDIVLVTDQPDTTTWPAGTEISYTVGASATFSLDSTIGADFDEAFNQDIYDLDEGLVGSLKLVEIVALTNLKYTTDDTLTFTRSVYAEYVPTSDGSAVDFYEIDPPAEQLPAGLNFSTTTGVIWGTPSELSAATDYTVTAYISDGSTSVSLTITVNDVAPSGLSYTTNPAIYTVGTAITDNAPSSTGGEVVSYSIVPEQLPDGLSLSASGVISGTPAEPSVGTTYTVTATNTGGSATVNLTITVNDVAPSGLSYATNPAIYTKDVTITDNSPSSTGGNVVSYLISPALPAGLSLDTATGVISGTPSELSAATEYTVTAYNSDGSTSVSLTITVNDVAPSALSYATNPAIYTKDVPITANEPTSTGGAVVSYSISPSLPAGLSLSASGVISGTPTAVSPATTYTVTATNSVGSVTATLRIAVNDPKHLVLLLKGTSGSRDMTVTFNGTGSWVAKGPTASAFTHGDDDVANSSDSSLTNAESKEGFQDVQITGGDPMNAALSVGFTDGQYVALDTSITMIPDGDQTSSFEVIGLLFNDDTESGEDQIVLVTDEPDTTTWSVGTEISYAVGASTTFSLDSSIEAHFDEAFNQDIYDLDEGLVGSLKLGEIVPDEAPSGLTYGDDNNTLTFTLGEEITSIEPTTSGGSAVGSYSIAPDLPAGLSLDTATGEISGTPSELSAATSYTVTANNSGGSATATLNIAVNDVAPSNLSYTTHSAVYTKGVEIANNSPSSSGGAVVSYSITPALPAGLSLSTSSGVISGTPSAVSAATDYTVKAINTGGRARVNLRITVNDVAPSDLSYTTHSAVYTKGVAITNNGPSSAGGAVVSYSISPALPAGLSFDTATGVISGKPTAVSPAASYTVTATNSGGSARVNLRITVNDVAPSDLSYTTHSAVYTKGVAITNNGPSSAGGAVVSYSISPALPAGLSFDTATGVISGKPTAVSPAASYTVTATNSGGSARVNLRITVNDMAPSALSYTNNPAIYTKGEAITDNSPSSAGGAVVSYSISPALPAGLSLDTATGVISGKPTELSAAAHYTVRATNTGGRARVTLRITVNDMAPSALSYALNPAIYTKDVGITDNTPSSAGGAVVSYSISPALPARLSLDTATGVISGTPTVLSAANDYTVTATNSGGSARVNLRITVNDEAPSNLKYALNPAIYTKDVGITDNTPSSAGGAVVSYSISPALPARLSLDTATGVISGTPTVLSAANDYTVTATNSGGSATVTLRITVNDVTPSNLSYTPNPAIYTKGVTITDNSPSSAGGAVVSYSISPALPAGLSLDTATGVISGTPNAVSAATDYTVKAINTGGRARVTLRITVNDVAPSNLSYTPNPAVYTKGVAITNNGPSSAGGAVVSYSISPALPAGLSFDTATGVISGTPNAVSAAAHYTVKAINTGGRARVTLRITVNDVAPSNLSYTPNPAIYTKGVTITDNSPSSAGGAVVSYSISPALPAGLSFDTATGVISGKPNAVSAAAHYTVKATNTGGRARVTLRITVNDVAPSNLSYTPNPAIYTKGVTITDNSPSSAGGAVVSYSISPALPAGLSFDTATGVISGKPNAVSAAAHYTVKATNTGGRARVTLRITVNDVAPSNLSYTTNPAIYTKGVTITDNSPSSAGGAVVSYSISPALPARLSLDTSSGVISGTPTAVSAATSYTVRATNSGGWVTATLRIAVNDEKHLVLLLEGTSGSRDMRVTFNGTGSWVAKGPTASAFTHGDDNVANSSDSSLGNAESKEGFQDVQITGGDPMKAALNGRFTDGQYVAFANPIAMTANAEPTSFNVIGLLFNDDNDTDTGQDEIVLVTDEPDTTTWSVGTEISYAVGASTTFSLDSGIGATFDDAFNQDIYDLDEGLVGSLKLGEIVPDVAPSGLSYANNPAIYTKGVEIANNSPSSSGGAVVSYSIAPSLPAGLSFDTATGVISGKPRELSEETEYTVTATNTRGSATVSLTITVNDVAPSNLSYTTHSATYTKGVTITDNSPSSAGGAVVSYSISPALPAGLSLDTATGVISGAPSELSAAAHYTVRAINTGGRARVTLRITVNDMAPSNLSYTPNPAIYTKGVAITDNSPSSTGGNVVSYSISPALPARLSLDTATGVISGKPNAVSAAANYTVTATNTGGRARVTLRITVNDEAPSNLKYALNPAIYTKGEAITDNSPSSAGGAVVSYSISPALPAGLSLDTATGVISGKPTELSAAAHYTVRATNTGGRARVTLRITVNDMAPSNLSYTTNPAIYTKGVTITNNSPSSAGGAVVSYSITPSLPAGLSLDTATGVISGKPTELSAAAHYTVRATNTGGRARVTLRITVNDMAPSNLKYALNPAIYTKDVAITDNSPSSAGGAVVSYSISPALPAGLSLDTATGVISGKPSELSAAAHYTVRAINTGGRARVTLRITVNDMAPSNLSYTTNPAIYTKGEAITDNSPSSAGGAVVSYSISPALPAGLSFDTATGVISGKPTELSAAAHYTVRATNTGGRARVTLRITVNDMAPSNLSYTPNPAIYTKGEAITDNSPSSAGGAVVSYSISPALPAGLSLDTATGVISGKPSELSAAAHYTVRAINTGGRARVTLRITVNDMAPSNLSYTTNPAIYTKGEAITDNSPSSAGGAVVSYSISPALPAGLSFDTATGVISGKPTELSAAAHYTVRATNTGGRARVTLRITVNDMAPSALSYANNPAIYTKGVAITDNSPSSTGGNVVSYSISPALPARLSLDTATGVISGKPNAVSAAANYTVTATNTGGSARVTLRITVNDEAPSNLKYALNPAIYTKDVEINPNVPSSAGGAVVSYSISPALPARLSLDTATGVISGKPNAVSAAANYTVTATNTGGSATVTLRITVNDVTPSNLSYTPNPAIYTKGVTITDNSPSSTGGAVVSYSITPSLPAGLSLDTATGVISGTPTAVSAATSYTVRATNTGGRVEVTLTITVNDVAPSALSYATNPAIYTKDVTITDNSPSSTGGAVVSYSITPSLPARLNFDPATGVISGTPTALSAATTYTVTATNTGGSDTVSLTITVNNEAPSGLSYTNNPAIYTKGVTITNNSPSSTGGAVVSYSITPSLPAGLSLDTASGVISGTPTAVSAATDYTVTATNSGGSVTATLRIAVNDQKHLVLLLEGTTGVSQMRVTFNGTGSWVMKSDSDTSFSFGSSQVANSSNASLGGSSKEALQNVQISGGNPMNVALSGSFENGQYVGLATPIAMTGDDGAGRFSFNVIGLLFDDDSTDSTPNGDDIVLVTDQPDTSSWTSYFTEIFYTVGASTTFSLDSGIGATFDEAFNKGSYTLDEGLVGSLKIANPVIPSNLQYTKSGEETPTLTLTFTRGVFAEYLPSSGGSAVDSYEIDTALPDGLRLQETGVISGTPTVWSPATTYTVTAENTTGEDDVTLTITVKLPLITVNDVAPSALSYTTNPAIYTKGLAIADNSPSSSGGNVAYYSITPALPSGLSFDRYTGVISGTPTELSAATSYTVRATNTAGWVEVTLTITVNDGAPSALSYTTNPAIYTKGLAIADNSPSSRGGNVAYYWITPALPSGLSFDRYTGVISGTPTELSPATYYKVRATNTSSGWVEVTLMITIVSKELQEWRKAHFSAEDLENPAMQATVWGNMANPDGDRWMNSFEFFFGTDPNSFDMHSPMRYEFVEEEVDCIAVLEFERSKAAPAGAGVVQYASDLSQWQTVSAPAEVVEDLGDRELVRVSIRLEQQATRHFMRLALDLEMF